MTYTKSEANRLFLLLAKRINKVVGYYTGEWELDYAPYNGGYVIYEYGSEGRGVSHLFGGRLSCREFCKAVEFALDVLEYKENNR